MECFGDATHLAQVQVDLILLAKMRLRKYTLMQLITVTYFFKHYEMFLLIRISHQRAPPSCKQGSQIPAPPKEIVLISQ